MKNKMVKNFVTNIKNIFSPRPDKGGVGGGFIL